MLRLTRSLGVAVLVLTAQFFAWSQAGKSSIKATEHWSRIPVPETADTADAQERQDRSSRATLFNRAANAPRLDSDEVLNGNSGTASFANPVSIEPIPTRSCTTVVIGTVVGHMPFFSSDHRAIYTELRVKPERVFKDSGDTLSGRKEFVLLQTGGSIRLNDGRIARGNPPADPRLEIGERYVFFLNYHADARAFFVAKAWQLAQNRAIR